MRKFGHISLGLILVYIAILQLNDPDPLFWTLLYLSAAGVPLISLQNKLSPATTNFITGIATGFCLAGLATVAAGAMDYFQHLGDESLIQDMSPEKPYIEEAREVIGTLIALVVVLSYWFAGKRKISGSNRIT